MTICKNLFTLKQFCIDLSKPLTLKLLYNYFLKSKVTTGWQFFFITPYCPTFVEGMPFMGAF